ncbi:phenylpyruvate tautomerase PptA (4-oxalocrotonate tautomerase family) [Sediminihabitans luteus]|uniref:Phenylpyruvate tautomerase PptA (4-oxalocrotonate tautomerase family) n=1 Tax=Sediminihabitans luteus TaxID=1138585 RepID=A0A2M9CPZ7_9CELL|nr:tautomerase family protein [Sediminihabitans luteus]PJJ73996.1 phenylpyruvate tautomerase PptA (4-oxalocrotonate tautomerase family) [Sediminihabitans luteus]GII98091.1 tautomerase [Sediminihabitans luteus]
MAQVKMFGRRSVWDGRQGEVSDAVHAALVRAWSLPEAKRFHRFLLLDDADLVVPSRGPGYLVVEVVCFPGRSREAKRALIAAMFDDVAPALGLDADDLEVVILESTRENWGIRGVSADELVLDYTVEV